MLHHQFLSYELNGKYTLQCFANPKKKQHCTEHTDPLTKQK